MFFGHEHAHSNVKFGNHVLRIFLQNIAQLFVQFCFGILETYQMPNFIGKIKVIIEFQKPP